MVPIVDLRIKFGMTKTEKTVRTSIIIMDVSLDGETTILGTLSGSGGGSARPGTGADRTGAEDRDAAKDGVYQGNGKRDGQFIIILDIDKVFSSDELALTQTVGIEAAGQG